MTTTSNAETFDPNRDCVPVKTTQFRKGDYQSITLQLSPENALPLDGRENYTVDLNGLLRALVKGNVSEDRVLRQDVAVAKDVTPQTKSTVLLQSGSEYYIALQATRNDQLVGLLVVPSAFAKRFPNLESSFQFALFGDGLPLGERGQVKTEAPFKASNLLDDSFLSGEFPYAVRHTLSALAIRADRALRPQ